MATEARIEHGGEPVHRHGGIQSWHGPWENHKRGNLHNSNNADKPTWQGHVSDEQRKLYADSLAGKHRVNWAERSAKWRASGGKGYFLGRPPAR